MDKYIVMEVPIDGGKTFQVENTSPGANPAVVFECGTLAEAEADAKRRNEMISARFVALALYYWGRGQTAKEALEQLRKSGFRGRFAGKVKVYVLSRHMTDPYVNSMGAVCWTWSRAATEEDRREQPLSVEL